MKKQLKEKRRRNLIAKALFDRTGPFRNQVKQNGKLYNRTRRNRELDRLEMKDDT
jgi:hypothetical protein